MFLVLIKDNCLHIIDAITPSGRIWTLCDNSFVRERKMNIFAADNTFDGLCKKCKNFYDKTYKLCLEKNKVFSRNKKQITIKFVDFNRRNYFGPKIIIHNSKNTFTKYQRLISYRMRKYAK